MDEKLDEIPENHRFSKPTVNFSEFTEFDVSEPEEIITNDNILKEKTSSKTSKRPLLHLILISLIYILTMLSFTYVNIINTFLICISVIFLLNQFSFSKILLKRKIMISIIIINIINLILFVFPLIITKPSEGTILNTIISILRNIVGMDSSHSNWNYVNFILSIIMCLLQFVFYKSCIWNFESWEKEQNEIQIILQKWCSFKNQSLTMGLYFICLSASLLPTLVNLCFLLIVLFFFSTLIFKKQWHQQFKPYISIILGILIPCFLFVNYTVNTPFFYNYFNESNKNTCYGFIFLYEKQTNSPPMFIENLRLLNVFSIALYVFGYFCVNLYLKTQKIVTDKKLIMTDVIRKNIDSALYDFFKESRELSLFGKLRLFISKYLYFPSLFLHLCRFGLIIWINTFVTYSSFFMIIWVLISMTHSESKIFFSITKNIILPLLILSFSFGYISNISEIPFELEKLGMKKYETQNEIFLHMFLGITIITILQSYIHMIIKYNTFISEDNEINKQIAGTIEQNIFQQKEEKANNLLSKEEKYILEPVEILFKFFILSIDIGLIVFLYFGICQSINIFNEIMLLFIVSLFVFSSLIANYFKFFVYLLNIIFQFKYIVFLIFPVKSNEVYNNTVFNVLSILFYDELKRPYYYWVANYLLYINYVNQKSEILRKCRAKTFSIYEIIENKFNLHNNLKYILNTVCDFLFGIYIWLLIPCLIIFLLQQENNMFFLVQLLITFIIYYKYIKITGINYKKLHGIFFYTKLMIITSVILFSTIYISQFLNKKPFSLWYALTDLRTKKKFELIGIFVFNGNYAYNLIAYIFTFIISVALHTEIHRQISLSKSRQKLILEKKSIRNSSRNSKVKKPIKENTIIKRSCMTKLYTLLYYILHYYWIVIFIVVAILSIHWMLSISMAIELILFSFYIMKSFLGYYNCLKGSNDPSILKKQTFSQKMKQYKIQRQEHLKITSDNQESYYNVIWRFTFSFIILAYLSSIALKFFENQIIIKYFSAGMYLLGFYNESKTNFINYSSGYFIILALFSVRAYILSKFNDIVNIQDTKRQLHLNEKTTNLQRKNVQQNINNDEQELNYSMEQNKNDNNFALNKEISLQLFNDISHSRNDIDNENFDNDFEANNYERRSSFDDADTLRQFNQYLNKNSFPNYFSMTQNSEIFNINSENLNITQQDILNNLDENIEQDQNESEFEFKRSESICYIDKNRINSNQENLISPFEQRVSINKNKKKMLFDENPFNKFSKDDSSIRYTHIHKIKGYDHSLAIQIGIKRFLEIFILILVLVSAVIKMNILSFVLIICIIATYSKTKMNTKIMFSISLLILSLFIIQYLIFLSNISYDTNPFVDSAILLYIEQLFYLPWYKRVFSFKWASFFSCGTIRYHITSLWTDVIILILCYFYLEFFSFTIYDKHNKDKQQNYFEKYFWKFKEAHTLNEKQFRNFQKSMKLSYNIELVPSLGNNSQSNAKTQKDKKQTNQKLGLYKNIRSNLYLSFHYFVLVFILLVASLTRGLISLGYITFSMLYIYKTHNFLKGHSWTFSRGIRLFLKPYLFLDIILQIVIQIPLDIFKNESCIKYMNNFGFVNIINYNSKVDLINTNGLEMILMKIIMYFLVLIQEIIYNSFDFKKFILRYHFDYIQMAYIRGKLHSYLFNNYRVKLMNDRLEERDQINDTLSKIEGMIIKWNNKLNVKQIEGGTGNDNDKKKKENKKDEISLAKILRKYWMISMATKFHMDNRCIDKDKIRNKKEVMNILKGGIVMNSQLDEAIEKFENENYEKYIPSLEKIRNIKRKNKEEQNNNIDVMSKITLNDNTPDKIEKITDTGQNNNLIENEEESNTINTNEINTIINKRKVNFEKQNSIQDQYNDSFFATCDYFDIKSKIRQEFFSKYYSKSKLFLFMLKSNLRFYKENFEYVCYFLMILNHFINASVISVVWALMVFIIGITQYPRPEKIFWKICTIYCSSIILIKYFFQLNIWEQFHPFSFIFESENEFIKRLGLKQFDNLNSNKFTSYVIYDFLLLCALLTNQFMLIRKGLWNEIETDYETIEEANERINKYNSLIYNEQNEISSSTDSLSNKEIVSLLGIAKNKELTTLKMRVGLYYSKTFCAVRNEKPGRDYYLYYTILQFFILIYIIIFYTTMEQDKLVIDLETFQMKQFSGKMVMFAFVHLLLIVFDRFIFLKNSRKVKKIAYKIYSKKTGEDVTNAFSEEFNIKNNYTQAKTKCEQNSDKYSIVCYQFEGMQLGLICKFSVQVFTVLLIHYFIFYYFPIQGNKNLPFVDEENNNEFLSNPFLIVFYLFYVGYFTLSGMQIKNGLPDMRKKSSLMGGSNLFFSVCYKGFKAVPFLFELKNFIDWTFTATSFDIFKWLKYEEIFALLFINKCFAKSYMGIRVGSKTKLIMKIGIGGSLVVGVLLVIFVPLVLFSTLNPSNSSNDVVSVKFRLELCVGNNDTALNFTLLKSNNAIFRSINDSEYKNYTEIKELRGYTQEQIQKVDIIGYSETNWDISSKNYKALQDKINQIIQEKPNDPNSETSAKLVIKLAVTRAHDLKTSTNNYVVYDNKILRYNELETLLVKGENVPEYNELGNKTITITDFYSKYTKIPSDRGPSKLMESESKVKLRIHSENIGDNFTNIYWSISTITNDKENENEENENGIEFITFSDLYSSATAGYNILTFYVAFVLVVGQYIRLILMGQAERVKYTEMVSPNKLLTLCEGIRISRIKKDFLQEGRLYYLLIDLMRSPEMVKNITKSSLVFIQEGNIIKDDMRAKVSEVESVALFKAFDELNRKAFN